MAQYNFRVSVEGYDVERVLGELLVLRSELDDISVEILIYADDRQSVSSDLSDLKFGGAFQIRMNALQARLSEVIDFLRIP